MLNHKLSINEDSLKNGELSNEEIDKYLKDIDSTKKSNIIEISVDSTALNTRRFNKNAHYIGILQLKNLIKILNQIEKVSKGFNFLIASEISLVDEIGELDEENANRVTDLLVYLIKNQEKVYLKSLTISTYYLEQCQKKHVFSNYLQDQKYLDRLGISGYFITEENRFSDERGIGQSSLLDKSLLSIDEFLKKKKENSLFELSLSYTEISETTLNILNAILEQSKMILGFNDIGFENKKTINSFCNFFSSINLIGIQLVYKFYFSKYGDPDEAFSLIIKNIVLNPSISYLMISRILDGAYIVPKTTIPILTECLKSSSIKHLILQEYEYEESPVDNYNALYQAIGDKIEILDIYIRETSEYHDKDYWKGLSEILLRSKLTSLSLSNPCMFVRNDRLNDILKIFPENSCLREFNIAEWDEYKNYNFYSIKYYTSVIDIIKYNQILKRVETNQKLYERNLQEEVIKKQNFNTALKMGFFKDVEIITHENSNNELSTKKVRY